MRAQIKTGKEMEKRAQTLSWKDFCVSDLDEWVNDDTVNKDKK